MTSATTDTATADTADTASSMTTSKRSTRRSRLQQASLFSLSFYTLFHNSNNHFAHGFTPSYSYSSYSSSVVAATRRESNGVFQLNAIDKSQTAIYDGAEFVSILSYLLTESNPRIRFEDEDDTDDTDDTDISDDTTAISDDTDDTDDSKKSSSKKGKDKEDEKKEPIVFLKSKNMPYKKAGFITFVTGSLNTNTDTNKKDERIIAVQSPIQPQPSQSQSDTIKGLTLLHNDNDNNNNNNNNKKKNKSSSNSNNNHVYVYTDSIATIPKGINDNDAISTASAALCGVQCGMAVPVPVPMPKKSDNTTSNKDEDGTSSDDNDDDDDDENENETNDDSMGGKTVILGGGDYACFTAKALSALGIDVNLVTTRPMSLRDTPLNPLRGSNVNTMSPSIPNPNKIRYNSDDEVGFSEALGKFDTVIDTLGDEAKMDSGKSSGRKNKRTIQDGIDRFCGSVGIIEKLFRENQCTRYVSTLTRSQRFVLEEGILFARDPVLQYQNTIESDKELLSIVTPTSSSSKDDDDDDEEEAMGENENYQILTPPRNYGRTIQKLFDQKIIYPADRNENGNHANKDAFVRGCSFPDYAEIEIWPQDSTDGAAVRFGFPGVQELTMEARMEKMMGAFDNNAGSGGGGGGSDVGTTAEQKKEREKKNKKQQNPFVIDIESLGDITEEIRNEKKDAVIFVSAPYCRLCRSIGPLYNRMARISKEELNSDIQFAKAVTGTSKAMKQLTFTLQIDSVPTFILFRKGEKYGESLGVTKLPSVKLNRAIESLKTGKEWDPEIADIDEGGQKMRTKL